MSFLPEDRGAELRALFFESAGDLLQALNEAGLDLEDAPADEEIIRRLEAMEERLSVKLEAMETRLLTGFHKWASPMEMRVRSHSAAIRALDLETEALSERVEKLEKK